MHEGKKIGWNLVKVKSDFKYIKDGDNKLLSFAIVLVLYYYFMISVIIRQEIF